MTEKQQDKVRKFLEEQFFNLKNETAYTGSKAVLVRKTRQQFPEFDHASVLGTINGWLRANKEYTLFRSARKKFNTPAVRVPPTARFQFQIDLADFHQFKQYNQHFRYVLVLIDCLTREVRLRALKTKSPGEVSQVLCENFHIGFKPRYLQGDAGMEFLGKATQKMLQEEGVRFFASQSTYKAALAERFIRTLKNA